MDKFNIHSKEDFWKFVWQFVKFGLVGVSNTLISLAVYYAVVLLLGVEHYILANTLGFVISVINAYIWNSKFVFQKKDRKHGKSFVKVFVSYGSTFLLGTWVSFRAGALLECVRDDRADYQPAFDHSSEFPAQ